MTVSQAPVEALDGEDIGVEIEVNTERKQASALSIWAMRATVLVVGLAAWQWVPQIPGIVDHLPFVDPFFLSSPTRVAARLWRITTGSGGSIMIWHQLLFTMWGALVGTLGAVVTGTIVGLCLSNSALLERVFRPFIIAANAVPRIALVPIVVLLVRSTSAAEMVTSFIVVFFLVFFNALEGGRTVRQEMIDSARLMGASGMAIVRQIRFPFVMAWVFAALPNAFAFGLVGAVSTEIFTGGQGIGYQLIVATNNADATLTFSVVIILTVVGLALVLGVDQVRKKVLPWWDH